MSKTTRETKRTIHHFVSYYFRFLIVYFTAQNQQGGGIVLNRNNQNSKFILKIQNTQVEKI